MTPFICHLSFIICHLSSSIKQQGKDCEENLRKREKEVMVESGMKTYTLYLVRHGEACHNVQEKAAEKMARDAAVAEGLDPDSDECKFRMEEARKAVLDDHSFFDASLSDKGKEEAAAARAQIEAWCKSDNKTELPFPTEVLVSPLQRTLQTADLVFPDHSNIRVREELRERMTGRPADNRSSSQELQRRGTFSRFSFTKLRQLSVINTDITSLLPGFSRKLSMEEIEEELEKEDEVEEEEVGATPRMDKKEGTLNRLGSSLNTDEVAEDEGKLRERTLKLFELLAQSEHRSVAIITHKGYLRGLERGAFGFPDAVEFKNCEVRVYRASFAEDHKILDGIERLQ
jgi:broad specificity phosphatase PhoE